MKDEKVSAVIPTYNRKEKLIQAVESIEKSDYPKNLIEILVVDDCSTDNTFETVSRLIKKYKNIKYFKTEKNSGPATARNIGIKNSSGKYIFFTDDDGIVPTNLIKSYIKFMIQNKKIAGVGGGLIPASKNIVAKIEIIKDKILGIADKKTRIGRDLPVGFTSNVIYRKKILDEIGYFDENFKAPAGEDTDLRNRICKKYDLASMPIYIVHNHDYNLNYLLNLMIKQGLNRNPPKSKAKKIIMLILNIPFLVYIVLKKTLFYRRNYK